MRQRFEQAWSHLPDAGWWQAFGRHLWHRFVEDEHLQSAGMLSYTTLLAVVPLTVVTLAVISAFPVFEVSSGLIRQFIFRNFVPAAGEVVQQYVVQFANQATQLTATGILFLVSIAVMLMWNIERTLNRIWRVTTPRRLINRFMVYWSVLSLGPLLIGASLAITSYLVSLPLVADAASTFGLRNGLIYLAPFAASLAAFTLTYLMVPNCAVRFRNALAGGLLAAVLFEFAKRAFAFYVTNFPTYEHIYGALATVPIFLIWLYVSWVVILLGASFAASLETFQFVGRAALNQRAHDFVLLYRVTGHLWQAQQEGRALSLPQLARLEPGAGDDRIAAMLDRLHAAQLARGDESGCWVLTRDLAEVSLVDLYRAGGFALPLPSDEPRTADAWNRALFECLEPVGGPAEEHLGQPLKNLFCKATEGGSGSRESSV